MTHCGYIMMYLTVTYCSALLSVLRQCGYMCDMLQWVAVGCSGLQRVLSKFTTSSRTIDMTHCGNMCTVCNALQCVAVCFAQLLTNSLQSVKCSQFSMVL